ncbi:MAG: PilZ domain-containing protein [Caulobacterales bacterium]
MTSTSAAAASDPAEKRSKPRRWRLQSGRISAADGDFSVGCMIVDISETGARVRIEEALHLPPRVYLIDTRDRVGYKARLVWAAAPEYGLMLTRKFGLSNATAEGRADDR